MGWTSRRRATAGAIQRAALSVLLALTATSVLSVTSPPAYADDPTVVELTSPAANAIVREGQTVRATTSGDIGIVEVRFGACRGSICGWEGSSPIGMDVDGPPFQTYWTDQPADGTYTLIARAKDTIGTYTVSAAVTVFVDNDPTPPDTVPPTVELLSPPNDSTINEEIELIADATDDVGVQRDDFRYCGGSTCSWTEGIAIPPCPACAPYSVPWTDQPPNGSYALLARAVDVAGNAAVTEPVAVTIFNRPPPSDTSAPTVPTLTLSEATANQHRRGTTLFYRAAAGQAGSFTVRAATTDPESGIAQVAFPAVFGDDGLTVVPPTKFARTYSWSVPTSATGPPATGGRTVTAINGANMASDASFTVTPDVTKPTVSIVQPLANATVRDGAPVRANASDAGAGVASVAFKYCLGTRCGWNASGATVLGPVAGDTLAPYRVAWTSQPPDGTYTLVARAIDRVGNAAVSSPVRIKIANGETTISSAAPAAGTREVASFMPWTKVAVERRRRRVRSRRVRSFGRVTGGRGR